MSRPQNALSFSLRKRSNFSHFAVGCCCAITSGSCGVPSMGGIDLIEREPDGVGDLASMWIFEGFVVRIAGLLVPVLALALVRREPYGFAGGEMELLVNIEDGLNVVVASIEICERSAGIAEGLCIDHKRSARRDVFGINAESFCGIVSFRKLHARLGLLFWR